MLADPAKVVKVKDCECTRTAVANQRPEAMTKQKDSVLINNMRPLQNRRNGFSAESRTLQFAGEVRRSADRRYDEKEFFRGLNMLTRCFCGNAIPCRARIRRLMLVQMPVSQPLQVMSV
jgi:hypothetical protein